MANSKVKLKGDGEEVFQYGLCMKKSTYHLQSTGQKFPLCYTSYDVNTEIFLCFADFSKMMTD
jgi:hypothetical protein